MRNQTRTLYYRFDGVFHTLITRNGVTTCFSKTSDFAPLFKQLTTDCNHHFTIYPQDDCIKMGVTKKLIDLKKDEDVLYKLRRLTYNV